MKSDADQAGTAVPTGNTAPASQDPSSAPDSRFNTKYRLEEDRTAGHQTIEEEEKKPAGDATGQPITTQPTLTH